MATPSERLSLDHVSDHAVIRYCERVLDVPAIRRREGHPENARARQYCAAAGIAYDIVRRTILDARVEAAILAGAASCRTEFFQVAIQRGVVTTVVTANTRTPYKLHRLKIPSRAETRRGSQALARRQRKHQPGPKSGKLP